MKILKEKQLCKYCGLDLPLPRGAVVCITKPIPGKLLLRWEVLEGEGVQRRTEGGGESASSLEEDGWGCLGGCLELRVSLVLSLLSP